MTDDRVTRKASTSRKTKCLPAENGRLATGSKSTPALLRTIDFSDNSVGGISSSARSRWTVGGASSRPGTVFCVKDRCSEMSFKVWLLELSTLFSSELSYNLHSWKTGNFL